MTSVGFTLEILLISNMWMISQFFIF